MFKQFNNIRVIFQDRKPLLTSYLGTEVVESFESNLIERIENGRPVVMVYGVYNAGKSTLINALAGEEVAEYADVPKTATVSSYKIGDVEILDTPGIDAPIEHEEVSREQLARSDAVIFVMSSGGVVDEEQTYVEVKKILEAEKPLIIVINNKSNFKDNDTDLIAIRDQFKENLYKYCGSDERLLAKLDRVEDYLVNAKLAMRGKIDNKPKMVEFSKLPMLEKAVDRLFTHTDSVQMSKTLCYELTELLEKAKQIAEVKVDSIELDRLNGWLTKAAEQRDVLEKKVKTRAIKSKPVLLQNIINCVMEDQNQQASEFVTVWYNENIEYYQYQLSRTFKQLDQQAAELVKIFASSPSMSDYFANTAQENEKKDGDGIMSLLSGFADIGMKGKNVIIDDFAKEGIIFVLKQGKALAPELFKGIGIKTMEKMAGKVVPFIGPAIDIISSMYDYYQGKKEVERQMEQQRQRMETIKTNVNKMVDDLLDNFSEVIQENLEDTFNPIILPLETNLEILSQQYGGVESDMRALSRSQEALKVML
ncbi:GTPase [Vibrio parahaemolyticus]|uniref:GTPase n=3 Tax=Vibrio parahaemolyticus TaxID=670 RepID=UPI0011246EF0|nr:GTPase [Vibrio parahaemolyticus]ELA8128367.1 50S ribosome-binding GTPase [Vibrio parahaemolyticus]TOK84844.1 hypothetical protein CGI11_02135 [Vibrio parahaemolyticus]TOK89459.1 hypothetical protein CGI10_04485 [Vibrio parahaemolyticus]HBI3712003.1 50S ribosome-binding GTPase [Vibrio parahaemolyticus]